MNGAGGFLAGSIVAKLLLDTKDWKQNLNDVKKDELTIKNAAAKIGSAVGLGIKVAAGAAVAAIGSLGLLVSKVANAGDAFNDMSKRVGISVETLSGYDLMAKKTGTSIEGMAVGFRGLSSRMLDAKRGLEAQKKTFDELGIKVVGADGKLRAMDDVLLDVADRFSKMEDGTQKAALAQDLFGRSGMELIPMLNEGRRAMEENLATAKRLGLVWSKEDAAAADALNDSLAELNGGFRGIANDVGKVLIPVFQVIVDAAGEGLGRIREYVAKLAKDGTLREWAIGLGKVFILVFKGMAKAVEGFLLIWGVFKAAVFAGAAVVADQISKMLVQVLTVMIAVQKVVPGLKGLTADIGSILRDVLVIRQSYKETADTSIEKTTDIAAAFEVLFKELNLLSSSLDDPPKKVAVFHANVEKWIPVDTTNFKDLGKAVQGVVSPFEELTKLAGEGWGKPFKFGGASWKDWTPEQWDEDLKNQFATILENSKKTKDGVGKDAGELGHYFDGLFNDIARGFGDAFEGMLDGTKSFAEGFSDIWKSIKSAFFRILGEMVAGFFVKFISKVIAGMGVVKALSSALGLGGAIGAAGAAGVGAAGAAGAAGTIITNTGAIGAAGAGAGAAAGIIASWAIPVAFAAVWLGAVFGRLFGKSAADKWEEVYVAKMKKKYGPDWFPTPTEVVHASLTQPSGYTPIPWNGKRRASSMTPSGSATPGGGGITFQIQAFDGPDVVRVVRQKVIPIIHEAAKRGEFWMPLGSAGGV